jgi:hypothetical protein
VTLHIHLEVLDITVNDTAQSTDSFHVADGHHLMSVVSSVFRALGRGYRCHRHLRVQINAHRLAPQPWRAVLVRTATADASAAASRDGPSDCDFSE